MNMRQFQKMMIKVTKQWAEELLDERNKKEAVRRERVKEEMTKWKEKIEEHNKVGETEIEEFKELLGEEKFEEELREKTEVWKIRRKGLEDIEKVMKDTAKSEKDILWDLEMLDIHNADWLKRLRRG